MARGLVLAVAAAAVVAEDREHDLRPEAPDHPHRVLEQDRLRPEPQRLGERARVAEVEGLAEVLARAVHPPRRQQLVAADDAEADAELGADQVLPAVAAATATR